MTVSAVRNTINFNVPAGTQQQWAVDASMIRCLEASQAFEITLDGGVPIPMDRGLGHVFTPDRFSRVTVLAPAGNSVTGQLVAGDGAIQDGRVTISAAAGLSVNVIKTTGPQLKFYSNAALAAGAGELVQALDTNMEWAVIENRGATVLTLGAAAGAANALTLQPGEKLKLLTGGPLYVTNIDAGIAGAYAVAYGWRN